MRQPQQNRLISLLICVAASSSSVLADGSLEASFDLNGNGTNESWATSKYSRPWFSSQFTIENTIWNGDTESGYKFAWNGLGWQAKVPASPVGEDVWSNVKHTQTTYQSVIERNGRVKWTPEGGGDDIIGNANYYAPTRSAVVEVFGELKSTASGGSATRSMSPEFDLTSTLEGGVITYTAVNHSPVPLEVNWFRLGLRGIVEPGGSLSATISAPEGAIERSALATHELYLDGSGIIRMNYSVQCWQPVPTPGTLGLAGLGSLALGGRRRQHS